MGEFILKFCGIDLAVKRPSTIAIFEDSLIHVSDVVSDEEILSGCSGSKVTAIDSPLSMSKGFRKVDKMMIRNGFRVLPPSWMKGLVERAIRLNSVLNSEVIETHPTSSEKNINLNWRDFGAKKKDEVDAVMCAIVAYFKHSGNILKVEAEDGTIYLLPRGTLVIEKRSENIYEFKDFYPTL
ncbi:nuclease [Sulfolobus acidocaldarius SUSAZ]|nr:nuclease [Sulfolobus acidocaldarius SUSAZ]